MRLDDFVVETAEENQIVNLISERLAQVITDTLNQKRTWLKTLSKYLTMNPFTDFEKMTLLGVKVNELGLPEVRSPDLRNTLENLRLLVELDPKTEDKTSKGAYDLDHHAIIVNIPAISAYATLRDNDSTHILQSTISHELQHALDNVKSQGRGITPDNPNLDWKKDPKGSWKSYAGKQHEVNARLQQALLDIAFQMRNLSGPQRLDLLIQRAFDKHSLDKDILDDAKYNRLLSRAYKFFQAEQQNPKRIEPKSLAQRALAWVQGGPSEEIKEAKNSIRDQIIADVQADGGPIDEYFIRFTDVDKLGYSAKQNFGRSPDLEDPNYDFDYVGIGKGKPALWFYPLSWYLKIKEAYATENPYVWLVRIKPNAWLQPVTADTAKVEPAPQGFERVGMLKKAGVPAAIFFRPGFDVVGKYYNFGKQHQRHGEVKGAPKPTFFQRIRGD